MSKTNVCIVGCGRISTLNVLGYLDNEDARVYAVCDTNARLAKKMGREWGAEKIYTKYADVLADENIHAIELLTPHHLHCDMTIKACEAGKHISVQKPMAMNLKECDMMIEAAKKAGIVFKVCENYVSYPAFIKAKELIDAGEIGEPISIRLKTHAGNPDCAWEVKAKSQLWRMKEKTCGGGPLVFDDGYHKFSTAMFLMGDVEKVHAWIDKTPVVGGIFHIDAPAVISWKYKKSRRYGVMEIVYSDKMEMDTDYYACDDRVEISGTKGVIWVTRCTAKMLDLAPVILYKDKKVTEFTQMDTDWAVSFIRSSHNFINAIKGIEDVNLSGEKAREVMRFVLTAMESDKQGRALTLDEYEEIEQQKLKRKK
ncbi:MAG: Gfo/Idh/MocA family oxidoreductase [Clostridiales bacterium]|nr:Gfo/Idh/MocA family oxidoreductase [Clostridiales bacterium]